jgi:hypothetical protein
MSGVRLNVQGESLRGGVVLRFCVIADRSAAEQDNKHEIGPATHGAPAAPLGNPFQFITQDGFRASG